MGEEGREGKGRELRSAGCTLQFAEGREFKPPVEGEFGGTKAILRSGGSLFTAEFVLICTTHTYRIACHTPRVGIEDEACGLLGWTGVGRTTLGGCTVVVLCWGGGIEFRSSSSPPLVCVPIPPFVGTL